MRNRTYTGSQQAFNQVLVKEEGLPDRELKPDESLKLANKSPSGFNWGYGGSGPSQLALAILLDFTGSATVALEHYQRFKWDKVAFLGSHWEMTAQEIRDWLLKKGVAIC